jgi:hypothetical protein
VGSGTRRARAVHGRDNRGSGGKGDGKTGRAGRWSEKRSKTGYWGEIVGVVPLSE